MQPENPEPLKLFLVKYKKLLVITGLIIFAMVIITLLISGRSTNNIPGATPSPVIPSFFPSITQVLRQEAFTVASTTPNNGESNVTPGEIIISFTTDKPLISQNSFSMNITPALPNYWKIVNSYPTNVVKAQVYGNMKLNTEYTITVSDTNGRLVYSWIFTTSNVPAESSSLLQKEIEEQLKKDYYPLINYIPYESANFSIDYIDRLSLVVKGKNSNLDLVKKGVNDWIRSKGVDPSTHSIRYENAF